MGLSYSIHFRKDILPDKTIEEVLDNFSLKFDFNQHNFHGGVCSNFFIKEECYFNDISLTHKEKLIDQRMYPEYVEFGIGMYSLQMLSFEISGFFEDYKIKLGEFLIKFISKIINEIKEDYIAIEYDNLLFYQKNCEIYVNIMYKETDLGNAICKYFPNITYVSPDPSNTEIYELGATSDSAKHSEKNPWWQFWR